MILTTWNMQGAKAPTEVVWQKGVLNMFSSALAPDAVCLQEAGPVPDSAQRRQTYRFQDPAGNATSVDVYDWGGTWANPSRQDAKTIVHHHWDTLGNRVNTAVVTREPLPATAAPYATLIWDTAGGPVWRPAVGALVGGQWIFSFHAISPGGADAAGVLLAVSHFSGASRWWVGGDFNREPATLTVPVNSVVCPPAVPTYPASYPTSRYDYFVCEGNAAKIGMVDMSLPLSDHLAVDFWF